MKYRVLNRNGKYYPQYKNSWWPFWSYFDEDMVFGQSKQYFATAVQAIDYCKEFINAKKSLSMKSSVIWEFNGGSEEYK